MSSSSMHNNLGSWNFWELGWAFILKILGFFSYKKTKFIFIIMVAVIILKLLKNEKIELLYWWGFVYLRD